MPQVAARISNEQEQWLKEYFRSKSAGAEFILPWAVDIFFRAILALKKEFSAGELKTIVDAHKDLRLMPDTARSSYLHFRIVDACKLYQLHKKYDVSKETLGEKLQQLDDTQATALMVWASAFWVSRECNAATLDEYVAC